MKQIKIVCIFLQVHFITCSKSQGPYIRGKFVEAPAYENWKVVVSDDATKQAGDVTSVLESESAP